MALAFPIIPSAVYCPSFPSFFLFFKTFSPSSGCLHRSSLSPCLLPLFPFSPTNISPIYPMPRNSSAEYTLTISLCCIIPVVLK